MHSYYRKAKRFKLADDLEVVDEFTGSTRRHGQPRWRDNKYGNKVRNKMSRFFRSQVGKNWDSVYSDFCEVARTSGDFGEYWYKDRGFGWGGVTLHVTLVDGYPHELSRWDDLRPLWKNTLFVCPNTKVLCIAKGLKREPRKQLHPAPDKRITLEGVEYWHRTIVNHKAGAGQTKPEEHKVWYKVEKWTETDYRLKAVWGRKEGHSGWYVVDYKREEYEVVMQRANVVSKKEIRRLKLNEKE